MEPSGAPTRALRAALLITIAFMVVEAVVGKLSGSLALLADAGHMLSDSGALVVALVTARIAAAPPDPNHPMGHQRAEVLGAALNSAFLLGLAVWISVEAVGRFSAPRQVLAGPVLGVAALGLGVNLAMLALLRRQGGLGVRAALWNVIGDALGSVGVLVSGALILWKGWLWADPLASLGIAGLIAVGAAGVLRQAIDVLMHAAPSTVDLDALEALILEVDGVRSVHDLHVWSLRPGEEVLAVHVVLDPAREASERCLSVRRRLREALPEAHITVQPEYPGEP